MLRLNGEVFASGRSTYLDTSPTRPEPVAKVYLKIQVADLPVPILALLDTGAAWSCLDPEIAAVTGVLDRSGEEAKLKIQGTVFEGRLVPLTFHILADEGDSLSVEGTVFVAPSGPWPKGWNVLGYGGALDRIRSGLDPQKNHFYFGHG